MTQNTFIIPKDVTDPRELRRILDRIIEQLDIAFGNRADTPFATKAELDALEERVKALETP